MAALQRLRVEWSGSGVTGPGLTTFYFDGAAVAFSDSVETFFNAIKANIPSDVIITVPSNGDIIEETSGDLIGVWSEPGTGGTITGTFAGDYAQGVGVRVVWQTSGIYRGRRVKGSTFLVPIGGALFGTNGLLDPATQAIFAAAAAALVTAEPTLAIYSRKSDVTPATDGQRNVVVGSTVPSQVSWLRSRRT